METIRLGRTHQSVSVMAMGTAYFGTTIAREAAFAVLDAYHAAGGHFIDTANQYAGWIDGAAGGESEAVVGAWLKDRNARLGTFVATKVGLPYPGVTPGLRAETIVGECEKSLKRLGIERIDLYYSHRDDRDTPAEEFMAAFDGLMRQGKIRYVGASNISSWRLVHCNWVARSRQLAEYCCVQNRFTYLRPRAYNDAAFDPQVLTDEPMLDCLRAMDMPLVAYAPLLKGSIDHPTKPLDPRYVSPDTDARLATARAVAGECNASINRVILAWMIHLSPKVIPLFSASTPDQVRENASAATLKLTDEQLKRMTDAAETR